MKGPETSMSLLTRNLFYLYEGLRDPSEASQRRICSTYMKGRKTSMSLLTRNLFYLYEGPRDAQ